MKKEKILMVSMAFVAWDNPIHIAAASHPGKLMLNDGGNKNQQWRGDGKRRKPRVK